MSALHLSDALFERAYDAFRDEHARCFPRGGDAGDHDEAIRCAVEAVVVLVAQYALDDEGRAA